MTRAYLSSWKVYAYLAGAWVELTADVQAGSLRGDWGLPDEAPFSRLAKTGTMRFVLGNATGKYTPGTAGALAGWGAGVPVKFVMIYDNFPYLHLGRIPRDGIKISPGTVGARKVGVTVLDWMDEAARFPLQGVDIQTNQTADQVIDTIRAAMPIQPQAVDLDAGVSIFPASFDTVTKSTMAYSELNKIALSEPGYIYIQKDHTNGETLRFENARSRNGLRSLTEIPVPKVDAGLFKLQSGGYLKLQSGGRLKLNQLQTFTADDIGVGASIEHGANVVNHVRLVVYPKRVDTEIKTLFSLNKPIYLGPTEVKRFKVGYSDPAGGLPVNAIPASMVPPQAPGTDSSVVSHIHFDGADGSPTITDETGKVWTAHGNAQLDTATFVFGTASGNMDGSGDYWTTPSHADFNMDALDFTFEWRERRDSATSAKTTITRDNGVSFPPWALGVSDGSTLRAWFSKDGAGIDVDLSLGSIVTGVWVAFAVCRKGNFWYAFRDGVLVDTAESSITLATSTATPTIGLYSTVGYFNGHVDELRISKALGRYVSDYVISSIPFTYPATIGGNYSANTSQFGDGTDVTSSITVAADYSGEAIEYTVTNGSSGGAWLRTLTADGLGVYHNDPIELAFDDTDSQQEFGYQSETLQQQYQQDTTAGGMIGAATVDQEKQPRTVLKSVRICANRSPAAMQAFLRLGIGDLAGVKIAQASIDGWYYIQNIAFEMGDAGAIWYTWTLREYFSLQKGLSLIAVETDPSSTDGIDFGFLPQVCNLSRRTISTWAYFDSVALGDQSLVCIGGSNQNGVTLRVSVAQLHYYSERANGGVGHWASHNASLISTGGWKHIVITHDVSADATAAPLMYFGGSAITVDTTTAPSGTLVGEDGARLVLNNISIVGYSFAIPLDGKQKDVRIFDVILTPAEISQMFSEGPGGTGVTRGLVFQGPTVRTAEAASFADKTLGAGDRLIDNIYGAVGTPSGTPITRAV